MGRSPKGSKAFNTFCSFACSKEQKRTYSRAAKAAGLDRSTWLRRLADDAARRQLK